MRKMMTYVTAFLALSVPAGAQGGAPFLEGGASALPAIGPQAVPPAWLTTLRTAKGSTAKGLEPGFPVKGGPTCTTADINCNTTVNSTLRTTDCELDAGLFADFWAFNGTDGDTVTIDLMSDDFDAVLALLDPTSEAVAFDDDGGSGANSRIVLTLDATGVWAIAANHFGFAVADPGSYTLSLACDSGGAPPPPPPPTGSCLPDSTTMCLNDDRFQVEVEWRSFTGSTGSGSVVPVGAGDSGLFYFFNADNWEMLVKVLDGCAITDHFWVFAAATTNVEYTLRVTDTQTGVARQYFNPLGVAAPAITDTEALATCP